jgi:hypothetical protein
MCTHKRGAQVHIIEESERKIWQTSEGDFLLGLTKVKGENASGG